MILRATKSPPGPAVTPFAVRRFTLAEYHTLIAVGVLKPADPYELVNGVIKFKMPQNSPHASTAGKLERLLWRMLPDEHFLRTQKPISLPAGDSEPEPDLAVVAGPAARYDDRHPGPADVFLVIEVSDSSLAEDRGAKLRVYAAARIPAYWVVNLVDRVIEVYTNPRAGRNPAYRVRTDFAPGTAVPVSAAGVVLGHVPVSEVLG